MKKSKSPDRTGPGRVETSAAIVAVAALAAAAAAQEIELRNDSFGSVGGPGRGLVQLGFVDNEIGAASFVLDPAWFPLRITRIHLFWGFNPEFGNPTNNIQDALIVYSGALGTLQPVYESDPIQLNPNAMNEFDLSSQRIIFRDPIPSFTVGMRFLDAPNGQPGQASLVTDTDGCQWGLNPLFALPGGWRDLCSFGASGDFVIRAFIEPNTDFCYPDCDDSGTLDFFDFLCFQNKFLAADPYADCDHDGILDFFDFLCFQNEFLAGCP